MQQQKRHQERGTTRPARVSVPRYFLTDKALQNCFAELSPLWFVTYKIKSETSKPREHNLERENYKQDNCGISPLSLHKLLGRIKKKKTPSDYAWFLFSFVLPVKVLEVGENGSRSRVWSVFNQHQVLNQTFVSNLWFGTWSVFNTLKARRAVPHSTIALKADQF